MGPAPSFSCNLTRWVPLIFQSSSAQGHDNFIFNLSMQSIQQLRTYREHSKHRLEAYISIRIEPSEYRMDQGRTKYGSCVTDCPSGMCQHNQSAYGNLSMRGQFILLLHDIGKLHYLQGNFFQHSDTDKLGVSFIKKNGLQVCSDNRQT